MPMRRLHCLALTAALAALVAVTVGGCGGRRDRPAKPPAAPAPLPNRVVRVLCYHEVHAKPRNMYDVSTTAFTAQMQALRDAGFRAITLQALANYLSGEADLPDKAILISFDDGRRNVLQVAKPILERFGFVGNLFLITGSVGARGSVTWDEVKQLASAGYGVGSHSVTHSNLTRRGKSETAQQHQDRIRREILDSYVTVEAKLGAPPVALAYPFGNYDATCFRACREAGYKLAFSIDPGAVDQSSNVSALPRKMIVNGMSQRSFQRALTVQPLHLSEIEPAIGERLASRDYRLSARVADPDALTTLGAEVGKRGQVKLDAATSILAVTASLDRGANLVRVFSSGDPRREAGWIVVCDP